MGPEYTIREMRADEWGFISSSFRDSVKDGGDFFWAHNEAALSWHHEACRRLDALRGKQVLVADTGETLIGWGCADEDVCHYLYVKQPWRRQGVARALWLACGARLVATHWTRGAFMWKAPGNEAVRYNPSYWKREGKHHAVQVESHRDDDGRAVLQGEDAAGVRVG